MHQVILAFPKVYSLVSCSPKTSVWTTVFSPGAGCECVCLVIQSCPTLCNPMNGSPRSSFVNGDSPGKNTRVGCHALLQDIFLTQGSNPGLPHCSQILHRLNYQGRPGTAYKHRISIATLDPLTSTKSPSDSQYIKISETLRTKFYEMLCDQNVSKQYYFHKWWEQVFSE